MDTDGVLKGVLWELRPWQWYKQLIVFVPLVFSREMFVIQSFLDSFAAAIAFSLVAGANYVINDILDREEDRQHPVKKNRPIASGDVSVRQGVLLSLICFVSGFYIAYSVGILVAGVIALYLAQNLVYSYILKRIIFIDITSIAVGFVLRAAAGVFAISATMSPWLLICTFFAALLLAIGKRKEELLRSGSKSREVLEEYDENIINQLSAMVAAILIMSYSLYTFSGQNSLMILTIPFAFLGISRYFYLLGDGVARDPVKLISDRYFVANFILWVLCVLIILYSEKGIPVNCCGI